MMRDAGRDRGRWRTLVGAAGVVGVVFSPTEAEACETSACRRWHGLTPLRSGFPRDAAIVFEGALHAEVCADEFVKHANVVVRRGDAVVPGTFEVPVELFHELVWYPGAPLEPGDYTLSVEIDNAGLEATLGLTQDETCGPAVYSEVVPFVVLDEVSPAAPAMVAPPTFGTKRRRLDGTWRSLACCPDVVPFAGYASDCVESIGSVSASDCTYFHDFDYLTITTEPFAGGHDSLWLYQLVVDGELVARGLHAMMVRRNDRACAHVEAIHLGTGEVVGSAVVCAPDDLTLGPTAFTPEFELSCNQALACGTESGWDPQACQPYTIGKPPWPASEPLANDALVTRCEPPLPVTMPAYPAPEVAGCGCTQRRAPGWLLVVGLLVRRPRTSRRPAS